MSEEWSPRRVAGKLSLLNSNEFAIIQSLSPADRNEWKFRSLLTSAGAGPAATVAAL